MTTERFGFFNGDSATAELITVFELDLDAFPTWLSMHDVAEKMVLEEMNGKYLLYSDAATMDQDESESEGAYYSIGSEELAKERYTIIDGPDREALSLMLTELAENGMFDLTDADRARYLALYDDLSNAEAAKNVVNATVQPGTPIHRSCACGRGYPDSTAVGFDPVNHDASKALLDSEVDYSLGKAAIEPVQALPPHLAQKSGKYWAQMKTDKAYFMGQSHKAIQRKAAIHLAWIAKFGPHS